MESVYQINNINKLISGNPYVGRGIILGISSDGQKGVAAYFIMGRSANSRNRIFTLKEGALYTEPFDAARVEDPSLIIYSPVKQFEDKLIVTNGDQTDTIYEGLSSGKSMTESLKTRKFEPDAPNLTPRISGVMDFSEGEAGYEMSILKSADSAGTACNRYTYSYEPIPGLGHFIHTYVCDGNPLPAFLGEPERVEIPMDIDAFTQDIWKGLDEDNRISLYVRYTDIRTLTYEDRLINKNMRTD